MFTSRLSRRSGRTAAVAVLAVALATVLAAVLAGVALLPGAGVRATSSVRPWDPAPTAVTPGTPGTAGRHPPFSARVTPVDPATAATMTGVSWKPGCPVPLEDLRLVRLTHWGFDGRVHTGRLVVHHDTAPSVVRALRKAYAARFPIRRMELVDSYGGNDDASMAAGNTSAFNCRLKTGVPGEWSTHSYGRAIDINPVENPYVKGEVVLPPSGRPYLDRTGVRAGMITLGDAVYQAFTVEGFGWGGSWVTLKDYQHFERPGSEPRIR